MHELSIANQLVEIALEHATTENATSVTALHLEIGALSCIQPHALRFAFDMASKDTILEGAELKIELVPATIFCQNCDRDVEVPGIQNLVCPICETPSSSIQQGRELDLVSIEIVENETVNTD